MSSSTLSPDSTPLATPSLHGESERVRSTKDNNTPGTATFDLETWATQPLPTPWRHPFRASYWLVINLAGTLSIALLMAFVAAIPILNLFVLGFLLDVEGRVARTGRIRQAFWLWGVAPRLGGIALMLWLFLIPIRLLASLASDLAIADPGGQAARVVTFLKIALAVAVAIHVLGALARGGRVTSFFRPIKNLRHLLGHVFSLQAWQDAGDHLAELLEWVEFRRLWWLGLKGFAIGLTWLVLPTTLYLIAENPEGGQLLGTFLGFCLLTMVNCWLPQLQANLAADGSLRAGVALRTIRRQRAAAPLAWLLAIIGLYLFTLPLHLFRVVLPPQDAAWLVTLVFVVTIFPTRVWLGYAAYRGRTRLRERGPVHWAVRWPLKLLLAVVVGFYTFLLFFTQYIGTHGRAVLFEQHAFLLPWPW